MRPVSPDTAETPATGPLVSVAFPAYCHEAFIEATMLSIYHQSHERLELVIVDDRSSDATFAIAKRLADRPWFRDRFERIEIVQNGVNLGAHDSLNRAMALARGDYISLLNSDDLYTPRRIELLLQACETSGARCAFSGVEPVDIDGRPVQGDPLARSIEFNTRRVLDNLPSLSFGFLRYQLSSSTGNIFMHRSLQQEVGGFVALKYCHDWDYMLRIVAKVEPGYVDEPLYQYRFHPGNSFRSLSDVAVIESEIVLRRYYSQVLLGAVTNPKAPSPRNWPGVFEAVAEHFEVLDLWNGMRGEYAGHFRTVDGKPKRRAVSDLYERRFVEKAARP